MLDQAAKPGTATHPALARAPAPANPAFPALPEPGFAAVWLNAPASGAALRGAGLCLRRVRNPRTAMPHLLHHTPEAAWLVILDLARGTVATRDLDQGWQDETAAPFDRLYVSLPRSTPGLREVPATADAVALALGTALLPALAGQIRGEPVDSLLLALRSHLTTAYAARPAAPGPGRGGLAPWQLRRARTLIEARSEAGISVDELARECRLSRSYFSRAFKRSTGVAPHGWLAAHRIERAKRMLAEGRSAIADIAIACGFADQSHLTRSFSASLGTTPAAWRRQAAGGAPAPRDD